MTQLNLFGEEEKENHIMRIIIAGSRNFNDYNLLKTKCDYFLKNKRSVEIDSGAAAGADALGEKYAAENGFALKLFPADWGKYSKAAGAIRNREMAKYADALILFWDGQSTGSQNMLEVANKNNLKIKVVRY
jgi:hypothetical protein